jgi:hypothetical protein
VGRDAHQGRRRALAFAVVFALATPAGADPLAQMPLIGEARTEGRDALAGLIADARMLGIIYANRLATYPDRTLGMSPGDPALASARAGAVLHLKHVPISFVLRADLGEPARPDHAGWWKAIADDLYARWHPARAAEITVGRMPVVFSKHRQFDDADEPAPRPFLTDRIAPDRRWGAQLTGDLGAGSYAAGVFEDLDALEARPFATGDTGGKMLVSGQLEWTPVAPMLGSRAAGRESRGPMPTPRSDPWFSTPRYSLGLGGLGRIGSTTRADVSFSAQFKWAWFAAVAEIFASRAVYGEVMMAPVDRLELVGRAELDGATGTLLGSIGYAVTKNRRNRVTLVGWLRRDDRTAFDAWLVELQASL